jgi:lipoprotein-releasing system ATP-binding protein
MCLMIRTSGITKSYGELKVLKGINIEIREKEVVSIVGASGAGKTTLLQIIGTLDRPDAGTIYYKNSDIGKLKGKPLASFRNNNIGFVFQFHQLLPEFTALENVCIPAYIAGKNKQEAEVRATELLSFLNLAERLEHKPSELSGGEQQRVAVARALINNPSVILADEPSGNLDSENKNELHKLFFRLRDTFGQTIIIVTHDRQLANMSDRILQIKDGIILNES